MELARSCERKDELDRARQLYEEVIRKNPKHAEAYHRLAVVHDKLGQHAKSEAQYRLALKHAPKSAEIHADFGYSFYLQHRWAEAEKSLKMAVKLAPGLKRAHNNLGLVMARAERYDDALAEFMLAGCNQAEAHANLMHAQMVDQRWPEARQQCKAALASRTASPELQQRLGNLDRMLAARCNGASASAPAARQDRLQAASLPRQAVPVHAPQQSMASVPHNTVAPSPAPQEASANQFQFVSHSTVQPPRAERSQGDEQAITTFIEQASAGMAEPQAQPVALTPQMNVADVPSHNLPLVPQDAGAGAEADGRLATPGEFGPLRLVADGGTTTAPSASADPPQTIGDQPSTFRIIDSATPATSQ
jgi:Tfp pilus assembly protein PilF